MIAQAVIYRRVSLTIKLKWRQLQKPRCWAAVNSHKLFL